MNLLSRQIEAVKESLNQVIEEWKDGEEHGFLCDNCPLCIQFLKKRCIDCPLNCKDIFLHPCVDFVVEAREASLEDIAGFLKSLLISLEEMK